MYQNNQNPFGPQAPMNTLYCTIKDGAIYQYTTDPTPRKIGVTNEKHDEAMALLNKYHDLLIEHGIIEKQKTPEEIQKENKEMFSKIMSFIENMDKRMTAIEENKNEHKKYINAGSPTYEAGKERTVATGNSKSGTNFK